MTQELQSSQDAPTELQNIFLSGKREPQERPGNLGKPRGRSSPGKHSEWGGHSLLLEPASSWAPPWPQGGSPPGLSVGPLPAPSLQPLHGLCETLV